LLTGYSHLIATLINKLLERHPGSQPVLKIAD
jgi:hypothetical protein